MNVYFMNFHGLCTTVLAQFHAETIIADHHAPSDGFSKLVLNHKNKNPAFCCMIKHYLFILINC